MGEPQTDGAAVGGHARWASGSPAAVIAAAALARSDDLIGLLDADGVVTWASAASDRFFGRPPEELVGVHAVDLAHPLDRDRAAAALAAIPRLGDRIEVEVRTVVGEGRIRWVEAVFTNLLDEPDVGGIVGHVRDITERREAEEAVQFQASILDAVGEAITARDLAGTTIYWNPAATALFGYAREEVIGRPLGDFLAAAPGFEEHIQEAHRAHREARAWSGEVAMVAEGGRVIHVLTTSTPVYDRDGRHVGSITASNDLTERIEQQRRTEEDHRRLVDAQASAHLGSFELDLRTGRLVGSAELWRILGRPPSDLRSLEHVHPDDRTTFRAALREAVEGSNAVALTHRIVRPDGVVRWVVSRSSQFHHARRPVLAGTVLDITERHEAEQALLHQATHDPLTGLLNRRLFLDRLEAMLAADRADGTQLALLFVDLDDFSSVNDRVGHLDADTALRRLGERIVGAVPARGIVGRLGGDEFVVGVDGLADRGEVEALVADVHRAVRQPIEVRGHTFALDASIGLALGAPAQSADGLLRNADSAMYAAKRRGRGRIERFDEDLARRDLRRQELVEELRVALGRGQVTARFQPEFDLATGALFGFEALARWTHPTRGEIGPDEFIPLAEQAGLIGALGRQMLDDAAHALARWNELRPDLDLTIGVNVSPVQLADVGFADDVRRAVLGHGVRQGQLCLEVTETTLMDAQVATAAIERLRGLGAAIAIDDFGTGYSSFGRLKVLPVTFLKIDRTFVDDIGRSTDDEVILRTMVALARSLGVQVIAEGIETEAQRAFLQVLGCEYGQGYLWNEALPLDAASEVVCSALRE